MIGKTVSHYRILEKLGEGGMGVVYKAEDTKLDRLVALKFLPSHLTDDEKALNRLLKEAKSASKINHNNVCTIFDIKEYEETQYIVMECVEGETLKDKIKNSPLSLNETIEFSIQICTALKAAHDKDIIHRDIKSDNIMVNTDNVVKVMDFGIARIKDEARATKTSTTAGTLAYMAPEQIKGEDIDHRVDIWAFGVVLFEMLTGKFPFRGDYEAAMSYSIVNTEPESMKDIPEKLEQIVYKALSKNKEKRYQGTDDMLDDLYKAQKEFGVLSFTEKKTVGKPKPSIAVLPFRNMSADPEQEYFCEGISEEIINALTHIENLHVVARTSAFSFKGKDVKIQEIGKELNVESILEGSVRKAGNRLRITAQLIKVTDGYHLWSERYDRNLEDVFEIQDEISLAIVDKLKVQLISAEKDILVKRYTDNLEAYDLYLKGRYTLNIPTEKSLLQGIDYFQKAIEKDPDFALAYTGLSYHYYWMAMMGFLSPVAACQKSKEPIKKSLTLDNELGEAHVSMANALFFYEWDWQKAEKEYKQAIQLNPRNPNAHIHYAAYLAALDRLDESIDHGRKAVDLDPLSPVMNLNFGCNLCGVGYHNDSIIQIEKTLSLLPNFSVAHLEIAWNYTFMKRYKEALIECERVEKLGIQGPWLRATMGFIYAVVGKRDKALEIIDELTTLSKQQYVDSFDFAVIYTGLGEKELAFDYLNRAYNERSLNIVYIRLFRFTWFHSICDDSRYKEILQKMGLDL